MKKTKLMSGNLRFVQPEEDGTEPVKLKEFIKNRYKDEHPCQLTRGNIIDKDSKNEQRLIFDCFWPFDAGNASFKIFLYENGEAKGVIIYASDFKNGKEYFNGSYKKSKTKVSLWGVWSEDADFKVRYLIDIELSKSLANPHVTRM